MLIKGVDLANDMDVKVDELMSYNAFTDTWSFELD